MMPVIVVLVAALFAWSTLRQDMALPFIGLTLASPFLLRLVRSPAALAALTIAAQAWGRYSFGPFLTPFKVVGVLLGIATLGTILKQRRVRAIPVGFSAAILTMSALVLLSETLAPYGSSMTMLYEIMGTFGMFLMLSQIPMDYRAVRVIGMGQSVGIVLIAVVVFMEVGWERLGTGVVRARGPMAQPNLMAEEAARVLPFALALLLDRENRWLSRLLGLLAVAGAAYSQFAAASRGGSLGMVFGLVVFAVASGRSMASRFGNILVIAALLAGFVLVSPRSYDQRVLGTVRAEQVDDDLTSERLSQLEFAKVLIPQRPFFGWGSTGFPSMHAYQVSGRVTALHSSILSLVVAYGIPVLVLYVSMVLGGVIVGVRGIRRWSSRHMYGNAALAAAAASFSASISGTMVFRLPLWFPILLLYLIAHHQSLERRREIREAEDAALVEPPQDPVPQPATALPLRT